MCQCQKPKHKSVGARGKAALEDDGNTEVHQREGRRSQGNPQSRHKPSAAKEMPEANKERVHSSTDQEAKTFPHDCTV